MNYKALANDQALDPDIKAYRTAISNLKLADVPFANGSFMVLCDVSMRSARPVVPDLWRRKVLDMIHALAHPGAKTTKRLIASKFVWHSLNKQVTYWARNCLQCQRSKIHTHIKMPLQVFAPVQRRFDHVHVDLVGPLTESRGCKYLLTAVDRFTLWPETVPITDIETITVARAYIKHWVARFGSPAA